MDGTSDAIDGFINAAPHAIVVSDERGRVLQVNAAAERLLGYGPGELLAKSIEDLVPRETRAAHVALRVEATAARLARSHDSSRKLEAVRKDGTRIGVVINFAPWLTAEGPRHISFIVDDEARRAAERNADEGHRSALEAGELSQAIIRGATLGIIIYDATSGACVSVNEAASVITGVSRETLLAQRFREIESWKAAGLLAAAESALAQLKPVSRDLDMVTTANKRVSLNCECLAITLHDRPHLVLMMDDRTEQRDLERQLRVAQKMEAVGQLAGGVAHDFNNLLTVIGTYSSLMLEECPPGDSRKEDLGEIHSAAKRAATLTRQLLAFSRRQLFDAGPLDLNQVVVGLAKMLRRVLSAEITFTTVPGKGLGLIHADSGQIEQALMSLVMNARDAMPAGGHLTIQTSNATVRHDRVLTRSGTGEHLPGPMEMVLLSVRDTGAGMDEATAAKVFEPFFTTKGLGRGTGLGLSTTYGIVKQSGGFIRLQSRPGEGTLFELYFPKMHAGRADTEPEMAVDGGDEAGTGDVVVVEDDEHVRRIVVKALSDRGYAVTEATNGQDALEIILARAEPPVLLVTDVIMPKLNGRELVRRARERWPELRVLFTTAYAVDEDTNRAIEDLPGALLRKPFVPAELGTAVANVLRGSGAP
ncbi:MAG: PAS domain-containing protein [Gemmatimonadetes bacterium]|nr:PAS domain-containing protein [Gemmatimonadota bacterium]